MHTIIGHCPRCGSPIWSPTIWHGVIPPPAQHSCDCFPPRGRVITTTTTNQSGYEEREIGFHDGCDTPRGDVASAEPESVKPRVFVDGYLLGDAIDQMLHHGSLKPRD